MRQTPSLLSFILLASLISTGCEKRYCYQVDCIVKDAESHKPLPGVMMEIHGSADARINLFGHVSNELGENNTQFVIEEKAFEKGSLGRSLRCEKEGYVTEIIEMSLDKPSAGNNRENPIPILFVVYMKLQR